jgi:hypothetical protein
VLLRDEEEKIGFRGSKPLGMIQCVMKKRIGEEGQVWRALSRFTIVIQPPPNLKQGKKQSTDDVFIYTSTESPMFSALLLLFIY